MYPKLVSISIISVMLVVLAPVLTLRYTVHKTKVTYFEAMTRCIKNGGHLATVLAPLQQHRIWSAITKASLSQESWWTSGTDLGMEGSWIWLARNVPLGSFAGYTNFIDGEPNNANGTEHCLAMVGGTKKGQWSDVGCDTLRFYVCEHDY
ncbi:collectin-11-like [Anopheles marshallii]|uniref:collectin-11-like n=1 Tax=Anopheles marshallii TaxID=1521116 RepID=UPI00237A33A6|nr:collectin-11-like [Anopheles marshallii]